MKKFYIIHSGLQHVLQSVLAFQEMNNLEQFYTSFLPKSSYWNYVSKINNNNIQKFFSLRKIDGLDPNLITNIPQFEMLEMILKILLRKNNFTINTMPHWRDEKFSKVVSTKIDTNCSGIFGFPNNLLESFKVVSNNALKVIEQPIGYNKAALQLFEEEKKLHPEFADSISFSDANKRYLERIDEELFLADLIFVPSYFVKLTLTDFGIDKNKIQLNPYGTFLNPIEVPSINEKHPLRILYVGQLTQRKGIKYLFEAIKSLKLNGVEIYFKLVGKIYGNGKWMEIYREFIDEYYPSVPRNSLKQIYETSDIFVLPSLFEGSALVVYEAMAHGLACIITPNTGADAVVNNQNGFIVPIRNVGKIINKISFLDSNREKLYEMKRSALKTSEDLSWTSYRNRLKSIIGGKI